MTFIFTIWCEIFAKAGSGFGIVKSCTVIYGKIKLFAVIFHIPFGQCPVSDIEPEKHRHRAITAELNNNSKPLPVA